MPSNSVTYLEAINMTRAMYGLAPIGAGYASAEGMDFNSYVLGGTVLATGLPLAWKGAKGIVWDAPKWAWKNYGNYSKAFGQMVADGKARIEANKTLTQNLKSTNLFQTVGNRMNYNLATSLEAKLPQEVLYDRAKYKEVLKNGGKDVQKYKNGVRKSKCYETARQKLADIKARVGRGELKGKALKEAITDLNKSITEGDVAVQKLIQDGKIKPTSRLGKIGANLKKYTGVNAISKAMNNTIAKGMTEGATKGAKAAAGSCKAIKSFVKGGGALTAAIELAFEAPEIIETFKTLGKAKGLKQLGKSAVVAVASGAGYVAGAWAGGKIGAAAGAAIGSVVPVIGNAVGAVVGGIIGVACGLFGSWLCGKAARAAVGPSELEKAKSAESTLVAQEAYNDPEKMQELLDTYAELLNGRDELMDEGMIEEEMAYSKSQVDYAA